MKRLLLLLMLCTGTFMANAQTYYYIAETGTEAPYFNDEPGVDILTSGDQVLSTWQSLPFTWNFFGQAVNGFYASDNGYITFDQSATTSDPNNTAIPAAGGPNNAIYAFWDDLTFGGGGAVRTWTIGLTPNQIQCVQWMSMVPSGGSGSITTTLRIYEGGDFDIVQDMGSGATFSSSGTLGCEDPTGTDAVALQSAPNTQFLDNANDNLDDAIFIFINGIQQQYDLSMEGLNLSPTLAAGSHSISGRVRNYGSNSVSSLKIKYQLDSEPVQESSANTLTLTQNGGKYDFLHNIQINLPTSGTFHTIKVWADINGQVDGDNSNDTLEMDLIVILGITAPKKFLLEKVTATWCGYCPAGDLGIDTAYAQYPDQIVAVSHHTGDALDANTAYPSFYKVSGIPTSWVDRNGGNFNSEPKVYPTALPGTVGSRINQTAPVDIRLFSQFDPVTRTVTGQALADFVDYAIGDLRLVIMVMEDGIVADQANFFAGEPGHPFENFPSTITGYVHNHTLRSLPLGEWGNAGTIPSLVIPGDSYLENFSFNVPTTWDVNNIHMVGIVMNYSSDYRQQSVLNATEEVFDNGVATAAPVEETRIVDVFPNPVNTTGAVRMEFSKTTAASFELYDIFGKKVQDIHSSRFTPGVHHVYFDAQGLANGVYLLQVKTDKGTLSERVVVAH